jgi:hypothetical protein
MHKLEALRIYQQPNASIAILLCCHAISPSQDNPTQVVHNIISIVQAKTKLLQTTPNIINIILFQYTQSKHSSTQYIFFRPHRGHLVPDDLLT